MQVRTVRGKTTVKVQKADLAALENARTVAGAMTRQDWPCADAAAKVKTAIDELAVAIVNYERGPAT